MKTNTKISKSELRNRSEQLSTGNRTPIDFKRRRVNRSLNTENLLVLMRREAPNFFALAEVVGKWVWVRFTEKQLAEITRGLAELGFHWNNFRQTWQHPCGTQRDTRADYDPRRRYGSYFAAAVKPV